jgi:hypothetical protein
MHEAIDLFAASVFLGTIVTIHSLSSQVTAIYYSLSPHHITD